MKKYLFAVLWGLVLGVGSGYARCESLLLHDRWEFRQVGTEQWRAAEVPGTVHQDLLRHRLLPDPFYGTNEQLIQWVEHEDWEYRTTFCLTAEQLGKDDALLQFDGLDTYADVYLNDTLVLQAENMFVGYERSVKPHLKLGENRLRIYFHSPITRVLPQWQAAGFEYPADNDKGERKVSIFSRKAPYHFGWDWGLRMVTSGVWRPVRLVFYDRARITDFHVRQDSIATERAALNCCVRVHALQEGEASVCVEARLGDRLWQEVRRVTLKQGDNDLSLPMHILQPSLWMPHGMGGQPLYAFTAQVVHKNEVVDERRQSVGLRKMEVICEKDSLGESFFFRVNGHPVYAKGANYIPSDILLPRVTKAKYRRLFEDVRASNMNMLRVWGGGVYEDDYFYHLADSLGILIWQDFMFACTPYPFDDAFLRRVEQEADYNIRRLRGHASIALWCGNNEILEALRYWGFRKRFVPDVYESFFVGYHKLFRELLPRKVGELDTRFYVHGSPYEANWGRTDLFCIRDSHDWGVWQGGLPFEAFARRVPRFSSEFGFQSFPEMKTVRTFARPEDYDLDSEVMRTHQKSYVGNRVIADYIERYYRTPRSFEDFVYLSQVTQGMGMRLGIEAQRRSRPYCMGTLYWQLNDIWPVASWSSIDNYGNWKALQYQAGRAFASLALSVQAKGDTLLFHVMSDELKPQEAVCRTRLMDFRGKVLKHSRERLTVPANASVVFATKDKTEWGADSTRTFLHVVLETPKGGKPLCEYIYYFCTPKHLALPVAEVKKQVKMQDGKCIVTLQSDVLVKDLFVETPWQGARYSDNFYHLLPRR